MHQKRGLRKGAARKLAISLDRRDPTKGYTRDNVVLCCYIVNLMKTVLFDTEFIAFCRRVVDHTATWTFSEELPDNDIVSPRHRPE